MSNFVFFGTGGLLSSICLDQIAKNGFKPAAVFIQKDDASNYPNLTELVCKNEKLTYHFVASVNNPDTVSKILSYSPQFGVIASFGEVFKIPLIGSFPIFNVHMGVLPDYRGAYTNFRKIILNHDIYGVTIHEIDEKIDAGYSILIKEEDFSHVVFANQFFVLNYQMAAQALLEVLRQIQNSTIKRTLISTDEGMYYCKHTSADLVLDPLEEVNNLYKKINRLQFYGYPELLEFKITSCSLLFSGNTAIDRFETSTVSDHRFLLKNNSGILLLTHL